MSAATGQLSSMAQELQRLMDQFKIADARENDDGKARSAKVQPKILAVAAVS